MNDYRSQKRESNTLGISVRVSRSKKNGRPSDVPVGVTCMSKFW